METVLFYPCSSVFIRGHLVFSHDFDPLSSFHVLDGEAHPKRAAFTRLAFHPYAAPVRLDDHPGLIHADAEPLLLGALKRAKQGVLQERRAHPAAIVHDRKNDAASGMLRADANAASRP